MFNNSFLISQSIPMAMPKENFAKVRTMPSLLCEKNSKMTFQNFFWPVHSQDYLEFVRNLSISVEQNQEPVPFTPRVQTAFPARNDANGVYMNVCVCVFVYVHTCIFMCVYVNYIYTCT